MENQKVLLENASGLLTLQLNNPSKLNCMGFEMLNALNDAVQMAQKVPDVKAVLIKGAGDRAFSTGADLKEFKSLNQADKNKWISFGNEVFNQIETLNKPTIAYVDGYAIGGGLELALCCDFRIGTADAVFSSPELGHGWLPGWGGMTRLRRLFGESVAKEVIFLGDQIGSEKALQLGLLHRVVENGKSKEMDELLQKLLALDPGVFALAKAAIADGQRTTSGADVQFDILALQSVQRGNP